MMTMRAPLLLLMLAASPLAMANTIYKCIDEGGGVLISNTKVDKSCRAVVSGPESTVPPVAAPRAKGPSAAANPSPANFPKVAEETQKARDGDRRRILEQELGAEQRSLEVARRDLADQEALRVGPDRLLPYRDRVALHERNIQAINKELANLR